MNGRYRSTPTSIADGDLGEILLDQNGRVITTVDSTSGTQAVDVKKLNGTTVDTNSGNKSAGTQRVVIATDQPNLSSALNVSAAQSGNWVVSQQARSSGGATLSRITSAASTNATSVKASAAHLYGLNVSNTAAYDVFLKFYNKASAPTVGTDTPVFTCRVKAGADRDIDFGGLGVAFGTGLAYSITKLVADSDTTAVVAGDLIGQLYYA